MKDQRTRFTPTNLLLPTILVLAAVGATDPSPPPKGYVAVQARNSVVIDGKLDDKAWADAPWTDDFRTSKATPNLAHAIGPGPRCSGTTTISTWPPS